MRWQSPLGHRLHRPSSHNLKLPQQAALLQQVVEAHGNHHLFRHSVLLLQELDLWVWQPSQSPQHQLPPQLPSPGEEMFFFFFKSAADCHFIKLKTGCCHNLFFLTAVIEGFRAKRAYIAFRVDFYFCRIERYFLADWLVLTWKASLCNWFCWFAFLFQEIMYAKTLSFPSAIFWSEKTLNMDFDSLWT